MEFKKDWQIAFNEEFMQLRFLIYTFFTKNTFP